MRNKIDLKKIVKEKLPLWITGMDETVVLSTVSLSRNLKGLKFPHKMISAERHVVRDVVHNAVSGASFSRGMSHSLFSDLPAPDKFVLFERKFLDQIWIDENIEEQTISIYLSKDEKERIIVNNGDHIEVFVSSPGFNLDYCFNRALKILDDLGLEYSKKDPFGFLTSSPALMKTGMRVEILLHLPATLFYDTERDWIKALESCNLMVNGFFGSGYDVAGNLVSIQNKNTHGLDEKATIEVFKRAANILSQSEKQHSESICDIDKKNSVFRAFGTLEHAYKIEFQEALAGLSLIKFGCDCGLIKSVNKENLKNAMRDIFPAHLLISSGCPPDEEDVERATMLRATLFSERKS